MALRNNRELTLCGVSSLLFLPESAGDVFKGAVGLLLVEPLVSGGLLQWAEVADEGAYLDIVEVGLVDDGGYAQASAIPCHAELGVCLMDIDCELVDGLGLGIAAHEGYACDVGAVLLDEAVDGGSIERRAAVLPQVFAVASRTAAGAVGDVDGEGHLVGYLLKDDASVDKAHLS